MRKLDCMIVCQYRGVHTERMYNNGIMRSGYTPSLSSRARIENLINSGMYKIAIQIRDFHGAPSPFVIIKKG